MILGMDILTAVLFLVFGIILKSIPLLVASAITIGWIIYVGRRK